jgi:hypothetical protein
LSNHKFIKVLSESVHLIVVHNQGVQYNVRVVKEKCGKIILSTLNNFVANGVFT